MFEENSTVVASKGPVSSELAGEIVILDLKSGTYYGLNEVGARIWELIQEPRTVGQIRNVIVTEYDVGTDQCEQDIVLLLQEMVAKGLVEITNETVT
jgi:hypothetical protein